MSVPDPAAVDWVPLWNLGAQIGPQCAAKVYRAANQTIPTGAWTALAFDAEVFDTDNIHDVASNTSRLTCRTAGKYVASAIATFAGNATGQRIIGFRVNGVTATYTEGGKMPSASYLTRLAVTEVFDLTPGDYVEVVVYQDSGGNLDVAASLGNCSASLALLGGVQGPPGLAANVAYGTSLPASPTDGQEAILVDNVSNPSYQWRFRYNAGSTSPYKWEYVGGSPVFSRVDAEATTTSPSWVPLNGPSITVPRAGDYLFRWGSRIYVTTDSPVAGTQGQVGLFIAGTLATLIDFYSSSGGAATYTVTPAPANATEMRGTVLAAGNTAALQYQTNSVPTAVAHFSGRYLSMTPVRVS